MKEEDFKCGDIISCCDASGKLLWIVILKSVIKKGEWDVYLAWKLDTKESYRGYARINAPVYRLSTPEEKALLFESIIKPMSPMACQPNHTPDGIHVADCSKDNKIPI